MPRSCGFSLSANSLNPGSSSHATARSRIVRQRRIASGHAPPRLFLMRAMFRYLSASQPWPGRASSPGTAPGVSPFAALFLPAAFRVLPPGHPHLPFHDRAASHCFFVEGPATDSWMALPVRVRWRTDEESIRWTSQSLCHPHPPKAGQGPSSRLLGFQHRRQCASCRPGSAKVATALGFASCRVCGPHSLATHLIVCRDRTAPMHARIAHQPPASGNHSPISYPLLAFVDDLRMKRPLSGA